MRRFENPCYLITGVNALVEKTSKRVFLSEKQVSIKTSQNAIKTSQTSNHSSSRISKFQFCSSLIPKVRKKLINDTLNINSDYSVNNKHLSLPILGKHLW